jgi:hypothetical protein
MNLKSKLGLVTISLLIGQIALSGVAHGAAPASTAVHAANVQGVNDASGNVYDETTGNLVTNQPAANVESATAGDDNGRVGLNLSLWGGNPNPDTDEGWRTNTPTNTLTYVAWVLATSSGNAYIAFFETNLTSTTSGIAGRLFLDNNHSPVPVDCALTETYSAVAGYGMTFPASCIDNPAAFEWNSFITYHPVSYPLSDAVGKAAPELGPFPTQLKFGSSVDSGPTVTVSSPSKSTGYWLFASDGGVFSYGSAEFHGSAGSIHLNKPIVGSAPTSDSDGYWMVASDGGIFSYGDAVFHGSTGSEALNQPIVGMAATPDGDGYWLVAADGGIFAFGDALFYGSTGSIHLNKPVVGMAATPDGKGYWLVASDGGIFAFGDARFEGSTGSIHLNKPIVGMTATPDGGGYLMVASDGGIFALGDAKFLGSTGGIDLGATMVGIAVTKDGGGYWLVSTDGRIFDFGDANYYGSAGSEPLNHPVVTMAPSSH